jgi:DNA primase
MSEIVVEILEGFLGEPKKHYKDRCQISFDCPVCSYDIKGLEKGDGKGNLEINYESNVFKCWACSETNNTHGSILNLIKRYGTKSDLKKYKLVTPEIVKISKEVEDKKIEGLPKEFIPLSDEGYGIGYEKSMEYLKKRNIDIETIKKYNIGYCDDGDYKGRIIFPSYDIHNDINYFLGRSYSKFSKLKYKNPDIPKTEIIFNENKIIWDSNIYIVEGVFDHIVVPNSIPMLGKVMSENLFTKLVRKAECKVIILLDSDAYLDAIKLYKKLNSTKLMNRVMIIKLPDGYDISDINQKLGKKGVIDVLSTAKKIKESLLY